MSTQDQKQTIIDAEHLRLLSLFHLISGIMKFALALFFLMYGIFFSVILKLADYFDPETPINSELPAGFFTIMATVFAVVSLLIAALGVIQIICSGGLKNRKHRVLSIVVSGIECLSIPYGTILGVLSLIVLNRDSVKQRYLEKQ